ncbi:MAG: SPOR domain-containing protein, partial [Treponema sp.]|nr:SPOR domain-containing protein [Treponema sp.]
SVAESSEPKEMSDFIVPSLKDLKNGKYYVQISVLKDTENIENLVNSYKDNYPLALVPSKSGNAYQIMVGPLEKDEYGSVMQKFKSKGFKDCFLRKIK